MTHPFKERNGVRTCGPCGKTRGQAGPQPARGTIAARERCCDARCPFYHEQPASPEELEARYGHLMMWRLG